jgi:hypothetical protein
MRGITKLEGWCGAKKQRIFQGMLNIDGKIKAHCPTAP